MDLTTWHTYAVENTRNGVVGYIDGQEWFRSPNATHSPMSACLQLDWFPGQGSGGEAWMEVDWLRVYPLQAAAEPSDHLTGQEGAGPRGSRTLRTSASPVRLRRHAAQVPAGRRIWRIWPGHSPTLKVSVLVKPRLS
ncbi:glycoside hydrolase family 16 protein [Streptosporangium lutulentum]